MTSVITILAFTQVDAMGLGTGCLWSCPFLPATDAEASAKRFNPRAMFPDI